MYGHDDEGKEFAAGRDDGDPAAAEAQMQAVADEGREGVPDEGGEEDERGDGIVEVIVAGDLGAGVSVKVVRGTRLVGDGGADVGKEGPVGSLVHAEINEGEEDGGETPGVAARMVPSLWAGDCIFWISSFDFGRCMAFLRVLQLRGLIFGCVRDSRFNGG